MILDKVESVPPHNPPPLLSVGLSVFDLFYFHAIHTYTLVVFLSSFLSSFLHRGFFVSVRSFIFHCFTGCSVFFCDPPPTLPRAPLFRSFVRLIVWSHFVLSSNISFLCGVCRALTYCTYQPTYLLSIYLT